MTRSAPAISQGSSARDRSNSCAVPSNEPWTESGRPARCSIILIESTAVLRDVPEAKLKLIVITGSRPLCRMTSRDWVLARSIGGSGC
jgi:hypothetical protein